MYGFTPGVPLARLQYFSNALQKQTAVNLILPAATAEPMAFWLLLHGLSDDETAWARRTGLERYVEGLNVVVAMPDGGRGFYVDAAQGFAYLTALADELPAMLAKYFRLRDGWAVGGLSMGGYGAVRFGLGRPDRFRSVHAHSAALGFGHSPRYHDTKDFERILGEPRVGGKDDLFTLASAAGERPALRIDCGTEDFLLDDNRAFHAHLDAIGFAHEYEEFTGAHDWTYWDRHVQDQLAFHRKNLGF